MNKLILCLFLSLGSAVGFSQKIYFVYLQSESEQPFFVKVNEKLHSSTGSGYVILPRLKDSTYSISIGFPENKWPEQVFSISINKKDRGYLLKNFGEKGWGLFDLQNLSVQMSAGGKAAIENKPASNNNDVSDFTAILSKAADDPTLKDKPVRPKPDEKKEIAVVKEPKKEEPVINKEPAVTKPVETETVVVKKEEPKAETPITKKEESKTESTVTKPVETATVKKEEPKTEPITSNTVETNATNQVKKDDTKVVTTETAPIKPETESPYTKSEVIRTAENSGVAGLDLVFVDSYDGKKDTIRVLIPNPKPLVEPVKDQPKEEKKFLDIEKETPKKEEPVKEIAKNDVITKEEKTGTQKEDPLKGTSAESVKNEEVKPVEKESAVSQPVAKPCNSAAGDGDFIKLRRKMVAAKDDDEMVSEARKYFKTTCFTVYQLRNLSTLFLNDEGKYKFFDAAYSHTSDLHNFISLQLELKEEYYIKRFKAMLK